MDALSSALAWRAKALRLRKLQAEAASQTTRRCTSPLLDFIPAITPRFTQPAHLAPLVRLLEQAERGPVRAVVSVPPRHFKTETVLHFIAWALARHPDWPLAYASYAADIAYSKSRQARDYARAAGVRLREDAEAVKEWRTTDGGGLIATGVGGPLTGHGARILIVDDPVKNREEAESAILREKTHQWFTSTATTRVEPDGSIFVVHTRWHPDDLAGRLERDAEVRWTVVNLPAVRMDEDGEHALCPTRWPLDALRARRSEVGEYDWHSLYQGQPRPRGGQLFREPARYESPSLSGARIVIGCDPAASAKTHADYSVAVVLAGTGQGAELRADILEVVRLQVEVPRLVEVLRELQAKWSAPLYVEAVGGFKAVPQMIRALGAAKQNGHFSPALRVEEIEPRGDKFTRAQPAAAAWNEGRIRVPVSAPWLPVFLDEVGGFTGVSDVHDDQVDALAHAFTALAASEAPALPRSDGPLLGWRTSAPDEDDDD